MALSAFNHLRVLDLSDESGLYCGKLLAELGAEVTWVGPGAGDALGDDLPGPSLHRGVPQRSLFSLHYNAGKRVLRLDLDAPSQRACWDALLADADVVIVTGTPQTCGQRGLDYARLSGCNPRVVVAAISPFGQTGPRAHWRSCDLIAQAIGGMAFVNGHPQEPPLRGFGLQAYHSAGVHAAIGVMLALLARERTGRGQLVDVSLQEAVAATVEHVSGSYHLNRTIEERRGSLHWTRAFRVGRCRDGYVMQTTLGDWESLVEWVKSEIDAGDLDDPRYATFTTRQREHQHIFDVLDTWIRGHDVEELIESAQLRRIPFAAVRPLSAVVDDPQLRARGFFGKDPCSGVELLGPSFRLQGGAVAAVPAGGGDRSGHKGSDYTVPAMDPALTGVRVLDFTWVVAGPVATRVLADHGADVIKVERRDATDFGSRRAGLTGNLNRGKRSIVINMADPRGVAIARDLARRCDVVIDNFSSRVMRNWELDYAHLCQLKPDIIAVSMSGFGHDGPHANHVSYGPTLQALTGFSLLMRHENGEPAGWGYSYSDMIGGYCGAFAAITALFQRAQTGAGQFIDLSQLEALTAMIGVPLLELLANGELTAPFGNRSMERPAAPHGIYRCRDRDDDGDVHDRWCAIAVFGDDDWARCVAVMGRPAWSADARFATHVAREQHRDALDALVETWTRTQMAEEVAQRLQDAGVAAGIVANGRDLCERDPHLTARGYWKTLPTPEGDTATVDGPSLQLSETPGRIATAAPLLGEHTDHVLQEIVGLDDATIARLRTERVIA
jgi:crotonobetainyl-CoA:carnitine CoA-transferase CaiB-like acyl-CoA transferase